MVSEALAPPEPKSESVPLASAYISAAACPQKSLLSHGRKLLPAETICQLGLNDRKACTCGVDVDTAAATGTHPTVCACGVA
eukprot:CAMPEP_0206319348 /NCGR_PEP_ID=MMETSP0106_2-20121207/17707_1 /ASSEMBLY_ACC=CAM_ASM_000206 /TAXON_ID=81532 /ORGANISM="Acanthoeca-like sp., Strain 10tr" /LENGTH=81 /DNA_ID=CAMNT_0053751173 /DNA_START=204 /DNA_END=449 /DNA_ORIENTATION=-